MSAKSEQEPGAASASRRAAAMPDASADRSLLADLPLFAQPADTPPGRLADGAADLAPHEAAALFRLPDPAPRLAAILVEAGDLKPYAAAAALRRSQRGGAPLGDILLAHGLVEEGALARALARQMGLAHADLSVAPCDPDLAGKAPLSAVASWRALPWRTEIGPSGREDLALATPEPMRLLRAPEAVRRAFRLPPGRRVRVAVCSAADLDAALMSLPAEARARRAVARTPRRLSAHLFSRPLMRVALAGGFALAAVALAIAPGAALPVLFVAALVANACNMALRVATMLAPAGAPSVAGPAALATRIGQGIGQGIRQGIGQGIRGRGRRVGRVRALGLSTSSPAAQDRRQEAAVPPAEPPSRAGRRVRPGARRATVSARLRALRARLALGDDLRDALPAPAFRAPQRGAWRTASGPVCPDLPPDLGAEATGAPPGLAEAAAPLLRRPGARPSGGGSGAASAGAPRPAPPEAPGLLAPIISVLVPLYREPESVPGLIAALRRLDYPPERLDVVLATEADDDVTEAAIRAAQPPPWLRVIPTPPGGPRTKPRALNHALDFCRGEIVGIYDAEDRPDPGQLRLVAESFAKAEPRVACLQARLAFHNDRETWLTRCFALEYALWFRLLLPGMARLGFPLPLAGTSLFLRRRALERLGAWDAWNVTEDADLGMRLARAGYRTALIDSETREEAVDSLPAWLRQRSRWQKGYLHTWLSHMRDPGRLLADLGGWRFLGFQLHFLGSAAAFLGQPLLLAAWAAWATLGAGLPGMDTANWLVMGLLIALHSGQGIMLISAAVAIRRDGRGRDLQWAAILPVYWLFGTLSALKALGEAVTAPVWWDKTSHGPGPADESAPLAPPRPLGERAGEGPKPDRG